MEAITCLIRHSAHYIQVLVSVLYLNCKLMAHSNRCFLMLLLCFFKLWLPSKTHSPVDKSACEQSQADRFLRQTAACDQSNSRQNFHHCPIRQADFKLTLEAIAVWSSLGGSEIHCDPECSATQGVLQYEMDAAVPSLQVTVWSCQRPFFFLLFLLFQSLLLVKVSILFHLWPHPAVMSDCTDGSLSTLPHTLQPVEVSKNKIWASA